MSAEAPAERDVAARTLTDEHRRTLRVALVTMQRCRRRRCAERWCDLYVLAEENANRIIAHAQGVV